MTKQEFKNIYNEYFDVIRNYVYYRSGDTELATDITQETFIKVWEKQFETKSGQIKSLLYKIAGDIFVNPIRHKKIEEDNVYELKFRLTQADNKSEGDPEKKRKFEKALAKIPHKQRTVFLMNKIDGLTYKEIAEDLNLSRKAVEKRMSQALKTLKKLVNIV